MRIIFLNTWHGKVWEKLKQYIFDESASCDIFCLTEVDPGLEIKLVELLPGHKPYYEELIPVKYLNGGLDGQSIFVKNGIDVVNSGKQYLYDVSETDCGALQTMELSVGNKKIFLGSIHGKAMPGEKLDTPERIKQSEKLIEYFKDKEGLKIIGGDFNLSLETNSVKMFSEVGYLNLIEKYKIKSTRNELSWEQFKKTANFRKQYYADYLFISKDVKIKNFEVPNIEISDHLPLVLDFEI